MKKYAILGGLVLLFILLMGALFMQAKNENTGLVAPFTSQKECNVSGVTLYGILTTYTLNETSTDNEEESEEVTQTSSDYIQDKIEKSENDKKIKAIVLEIDSYGGYPVAGEEVANALKRAQKPTVALIRSSGTSAAYWAATGADAIYASVNSDIGGIGATMSYLDNVDKNKKEGFTYNEIASARFKDYGDPNKPLTKEEHDLLLRDIRIIHDNFVRAVAENRNLDINKVEEIADGSRMLGQMAITSGLIDRIGGIQEVEEYLKEKIGEDVSICWQ